jgi:DNA-binding transcriptional ArsR family regulator
METEAAVVALSALAHESRLQAFRLLVRTGAEGMPAGEIAEELGIAPPTLSFHLAQLVRAGLVDSRRNGRSVLYSLRVDGIRGLLGFVTEDCCQGRPELCAPGAGSVEECATCRP